MTTPAEAAEPRSGFRVRRLRLAVGTSLMSKAMGLGVQLLGVPIAITALGVERFGIYTMLVSLLAWIDLGSFGMGPGLTRGMAVAWNRGDQRDEQRYFSSGIVVLAVIVLCLGLIFSAGAAYVFGTNLSLQRFFGPNGDEYRNEIRWAMVVIAIFFLSQLLFSIGERARSAFQEDYINNAVNMVASLFSLVMMLVIARFWKTIEGFALGFFAALTIAKVLNTGSLILLSRPYLFPTRATVDGATVRQLLSNGIPFWVMQAANLVMQSLSLFLLGWIAGPKALAPFAVLFRLLQMLATGVTMLTQPLWPSITDASVRGDHDWIRHSYNRVTMYVLVYSLSAFFVFTVMGQTLLHFWLKGTVLVDRSLIVVMALYFVVWMWNTLHNSVFFGLGWLWEAATCMSMEGLVGVSLGSFLARTHGALGMVTGMLIGAITVTAWVQPILLRRRQFGIKREEGQES